MKKYIFPILFIAFCGYAGYAYTIIQDVNKEVARIESLDPMGLTVFVVKGTCDSVALDKLDSIAKISKGVSNSFLNRKFKTLAITFNLKQVNLKDLHSEISTQSNLDLFIKQKDTTAVSKCPINYEDSKSFTGKFTMYSTALFNL